MVIIIMIMIIKSGSGDNNFYIGNLGTREKQRERTREERQNTLYYMYVRVTCKNFLSNDFFPHTTYNMIHV